MNAAVRSFRIPVLAVINALVLGALTIWLTSGSLDTVVKAYQGLLEGAFSGQRGLSETLVAAIPYVFASLAVALAFQAGLFNIGVEGQFTVGALSAVFVGTLSHDWPALIHLPLTILGAMAGAGLWAGIAGVLKARFGAHEVINTIMMNYIAFRLGEYLISDKSRMRDPVSSAIQTSSISHEAELWSLWDVPNRLHVPLNALLLGIVLALLGFVLARSLAAGSLPAALRWARREAASSPVARALPAALRWARREAASSPVARALPAALRWARREAASSPAARALPAALPWARRDPRSARLVAAGGALAGLVIGALIIPLTIAAWWPFNSDKDRLHIGVFIAPAAAVIVWWLIYKTTIGFELRTVGRNANAAIYAGINRGRNIVLAMVLSGALAGLAGATEVMGVSGCRCLPLFFSSGYGFDAIAIALVAATHPLGILPVALLFGALRNGADLMELRSGVSKFIISLLQAFVLLFVAAPIITRAIYRIRAPRGGEDEVPLTRGWGS